MERINSLAVEPEVKAYIILRKEATRVGSIDWIFPQLNNELQLVGAKKLKDLMYLLLLISKDCPKFHLNMKADENQKENEVIQMCANEVNFLCHLILFLSNFEFENFYKMKSKTAHGLLS